MTNVVTTNYQELERLESISDEGGALMAVTGLVWDLSHPEDREALPEKCVAGIELAFEHCICLIQAIAADDTIQVLIRTQAECPGANALDRWKRELTSANQDCLACSLSEKPPWSRLVGHSVLWAWVMRNHRAPGDDAVQFHIGSDVIQLVTMASTLCLSIVRETDFVLSDHELTP